MDRIAQWNEEKQRFELVSVDGSGIQIKISIDSTPIFYGGTVDKIAAYEDELELIREFISKNGLIHKLAKFKEEKELPEILPCPFCGEKGVVSFIYAFDKYHVSCTNRNCCITSHTVNYDSKEEAIKAWNKRA